MARPALRLLITLVFVITLAPMCVETYIPALPEVAREFGADIEVVQLTLSMYLFGFAAAHLLYGAAADHFGRKPVLFGGLALFLLSTVACALSTTLGALIAFRFLQAVGVSSVIIIPRAIVRDLYGPDDSARALSYVSMAMAAAPIVSPILGSYLVTRLSWHAVFWLIAAYGLVVTVAFRAFVPESLPERRDVGFSFGSLVRNKTTLLADRRFVGYLLCMTCVSSGMFVFISLSPFVLIEHMRVPREDFGYLYALGISGFMCGTAACGRLSGRIPARRIIGIGLSIAAAGAACMFGTAVGGVMHPAAVVASHFLYVCGMGLVMPQCFASAMAPVPHLAATASALMGFVQITVASLLVTIMGFFQEGGQVVIGLVMTVMVLLASAAFSGLVLGRSALRSRD
jgi:DHA1 family bicyclomycin/chloramphenicol resistance-like MFS transporter